MLPLDCREGWGEGGISYPVCYILRIIKVCDLLWYKRRGMPAALRPRCYSAQACWTWCVWGGVYRNVQAFGNRRLLFRGRMFFLHLACF